MRTLSTVHTTSARSVSVQRALRTSPSPKRGGEQHQELERQHSAGVHAGVAHPRGHHTNFGVRQRPLVLRGGPVARQCRGNHVVRRGILPVALGERPLQHRADTPAQAVRRLALRRPDQSQHRRDIAGGDGVDAPGSEAWHHVLARFARHPR